MSKKKQTEVIQAVAYCRKSTNTERTEKSIADQRTRITKLKPVEESARYEIVRWYEKDKGIPGWKQGAERPDYFKLVGELKETGAKAILVDDMDRFSRADNMDTVRDVSILRDMGVRYLHAVNQGCRDLVEGGGMVTMQIAMEANASHEFSTRLSRRIANARLDAAKQGMRSGGLPPYGMAMADADGKPISEEDKGRRRGCRLIFGDPKLIKIVRQIFDWFVKHLKSMNWIAAELNRQKVPARHGGVWYVKAIKEVLQRREYRGDFSYNSKKSGQFHIVNGNQEVQAVYRD